MVGAIGAAIEPAIDGGSSAASASAGASESAPWNNAALAEGAEIFTSAVQGYSNIGENSKAMGAKAEAMAQVANYTGASEDCCPGAGRNIGGDKFEQQGARNNAAAGNLDLDTYQGAMSSFMTPVFNTVLGMAGGSIFNSMWAGYAVGESGIIWNFIKATQPVYRGTVLPKSFELTVQNGKRFWVHANATKHIAEYVESKAANFTSNYVNLVTQQMLRSLQASVNAATQKGIIYDEIMQVGGWELKFGAPRAAGDLPVLFHALPIY